MPSVPEPIVVEASGDFLGDDGAWSPSLIRVGNPPTQLRVLVSTEIPETWVVYPGGCIATDPQNCTQTRGGLYNHSVSTTWAKKGRFGLGAESNLGYTGNSDAGEYGFDTLGVGMPGRGNVSLDQQLIAGIETKDFYLGNLGLANRQLAFVDGTQAPGFLPQLQSNNRIPSLSYGYTAGASYHQSNASLTLGGFDASRFTPNDVTFSFASDPLRSKVVALQSVVATGSQSETTLLNQPIWALVDSTVPHIWLPEDSCQAFENAFGLTHDVPSDLYLINDTTHDALIKKDASISFQLSNALAGGAAVNITLPYRSFDLNVSASYPNVKSQTRYFPLRRAASDSQYTLGRTFFQESFLIVDYESKNFSISQSVFSNDVPRIVAVQPVQTQTTASSPTTSPTGTGSSTTPVIIKTTTPPSNSHALGTPAIAGIAVAIVVLLAIAGAVGVWLRIKRRRERRRQLAENTPELPAHPTFPRGRAELEDEEAQGQLSAPAHDQKGPRSSIEEVSDEKIQTQMDQQEIGLMNQGHHGIHGNEMSGSEVLTPELPSPDPFIVPAELSPDAELIRSELSTPEPVWRAEMSSPEMVSTEMPAAADGGTAAGERSPPLGGGPSPLSSPDSAYPRNRTLSRRPVPGSVDSSESEGGWTRDGIAPVSGRQARHSRTHTAESSEARQQSGLARDRIPSSASSRQRPQHTRVDSSDSESTIPPRPFKSVRPSQHVRVDSSDSEAFPTPPQRRPSLPPSRPAHRRLDSKDSSETFETRLEQSPPGSPFPPQSSRPARDRPIEALPSLGLKSSQEALVSPSASSIRSGLRSPEPWERELLEVDEDNAIGSETKRKE